MLAFDLIAEQRISEALERGELDHLPGAGQPLQLDDDRLVPEDVRMAYRILKNAGFVPPEVQTLKEIGALQRLVQSLEEGEQRTLALKKLHLLAMQLGETRGGYLQQAITYYDKIVSTLA
ncbi:MAG: DUF1992 domain-containing protein [Methylophilaceae bacterium]|nr:DUF1992 domain-containing protein [Methylophilaceae bacterium]